MLSWKGCRSDPETPPSTAKELTERSLHVPASGFGNGEEAPYNGAMTEGAINSMSLLVLGLFLGMRHATDADHIVAVATIVSRQRTMRGSMLIGAAWGIGHSLTVMAVGGAIILFGAVIPPWLGLSMEFAVGGMLVLLGVLTLTGVGRGLTAPRAGQPHDHVHAHGDYIHRHPTDIHPRPMATAPSTRLWPSSTTAGWVDWHSTNGCAPLPSGWCTASPARPPLPCWS